CLINYKSFLHLSAFVRKPRPVACKCGDVTMLLRLARSDRGRSSATGEGARCLIGPGCHGLAPQSLRSLPAPPSPNGPNGDGVPALTRPDERDMLQRTVDQTA